MVFFEWLAIAVKRQIIDSLPNDLILWSPKALFKAGLGILLCLALLWPQPAQASIHTYPETEQTTMYRSRLSLRDDQELAWQTILFKRVKEGQVIDFNLRLISFPGQLELSHPQSLWVQQDSHRSWELIDETLLDPQLEWSQSSLAQYDAKPLFLSLERPTPLRLSIALNDNEQREILVPPYVVKEWLQLQDLPLD